MQRSHPYLAYTLLGIYVASCLVPIGGLSSVRQMQIGYALGCAGWLMLIHNVWRRTRRAPRIGELLLVAVALRLFLLAAPVSDDVYRYVWEGRVRLAGFNPYLLAPDDPALAHLRDAGWPQINHPDHPAIYPPLAEGFCALVAAIHPGPFTFKIAFLIADLLTVAALAGWLRVARLDPRRVIVYALCPATLSAFARLAHIDVLMLLGVAVFLYWCETLRQARSHERPALMPVLLSGLALGAAIGTKWVPLILVPCWLVLILTVGGPGRWKTRAASLAAGVAGLALPLIVPALFYADAGRSMIENLFHFGREFHLLDSARQLLALAFDARMVGLASAAIMLGAVLVIALRRMRVARSTLWTFGIFILLLPTVHPWYATWLLGPLCAAMSAPWILLPITMVFGFEGDHMLETTGQWMMPAWVVRAVFLPVYAAMIAVAFGGLKRSRP